MATIRYPAQGSTQTFEFTPLSSAIFRAAAGAVIRHALPRAVPMMAAALGKLAGMGNVPRRTQPAESISMEAFLASVRRSNAMRSRLPSNDLAQLGLMQPKVQASRGPSRARGGPMPRPNQLTFLTPTLIVEGARMADLKAARDAGARIIEEGLDGKVLIAVDRLDQVSPMCELLRKREVGSVTPNFLRRLRHTALSAPKRPWAHAKIRVPAAWAITKGSKDIRVAVLDEGVDTSHPALKMAVVAERDFIGDKGNSAKPDGDDAHGTTCAGIILARGRKARGIAPNCGLIAARIAMDDGNGHWVFDDFATAEAIDWCWREGADVLSNSWGGGAPSDAISRAFGRARTQGRGGKGSVVCIAAGNDQDTIDFPGDLPGYVTVGASSPKDERKTRTSSDGEDWWGSNYGDTLWLLAPGVFIHCTDISGPRGYDAGDYTPTFNGTSSATPHVAGTVALMLSANPGLSASDVRIILSKTAKPLAGQSGWNAELGHGRLDTGAAVVAARKHAPARKRARAKKRA